MVWMLLLHAAAAASMRMPWSRGADRPAKATLADDAALTRTPTLAFAGVPATDAEAETVRAALAATSECDGGWLAKVSAYDALRFLRAQATDGSPKDQSLADRLREEAEWRERERIATILQVGP